jgi:hypothetical protein
MPRPLPRDRWLADAAERFTALDAWRQEHPRATWTEIEAAVEAQLGPLRAQVLGDTAVASDATDLRGERPVCPVCGGPVTAAGRRPRHLRGEGDQPIALDRTYARCPACDSGLFPPG